MTDITIGEVRSRIIAAPWEDRPGGRGRTAYSFNSYPRPRLPRLCVSPLSFPAHVLRFVVFGGAFVCIFLHFVPLLPRLCRMIAIRKRIKIGPSRSWKLSKGWGLPNVGLNYREMLPLTWGCALGPFPRPTCKTRSLARIPPPGRSTLYLFRISIANRLRLRRVSNGKGKLGGGLRNRYVREFATQSGITRAWSKKLASCLLNHPIAWEIAANQYIRPPHWRTNRII